NSVENTNAYNMSVNYTKLADYLELTAEQLEDVKDIHNEFCADMMNATEETGESRKFMVKNAVYKDLTYMRYVLDNDQYHKYLKVLNATFNNRGLNK
ncbi:MAG: hypothetical protein LUD48_02400, partial [Prevotella sp.]|nr:hypothetical protein [Prevotella sp.]